jgi:hypothetical protein
MLIYLGKVLKGKTTATATVDVTALAPWVATQTARQTNTDLICCPNPQGAKISTEHDSSTTLSVTFHMRKSQ